jgi:hypothetical protein
VEQSDKLSNSDGDTSTSEDGIETNMLSMKRSSIQSDDTSDCDESFHNDSSDNSIIDKDKIAAGSFKKT